MSIEERFPPPQLTQFIFCLRAQFYTPWPNKNVPILFWIIFQKLINKNKYYFIITISRVLSFIGKIWAKSAKAFLRNLEFNKKSRFYPIPMGFTTLTHMCAMDLGHEAY